MLTLPNISPVDYLVVGHLTKDLTPNGKRMGGTAAYSALTARALGLKVGIVTSIGSDLDLSILDGIQVAALPDEQSTTFENIQTPQGRIQHVYHVAPMLGYHLIPEAWRSTPIVHLGPIAQESDPSIIRGFPNSFIGVTPQGYLRAWNEQGLVFPTEWPEARYVLEQASAAVISIEDVQGDESRIEEMASSIRILVVTEAAAGARLFWNGDLRRFKAPSELEIDPVGAGDIFAAAFFARLYSTRDPWEAARFATQLAAISVTRPGLSGVPSPEEVQSSLLEIL
jgi:sugar/nucleoside kinase (ribokinase family)